MFENGKTGTALWDVTIFKSDMSPEIFPIRCDAARSAWTPLSLVLRMYVWYFLRMWHYLLSECAIANSYFFFLPISLENMSTVSLFKIYFLFFVILFLFPLDHFICICIWSGVFQNFYSDIVSFKLWKLYNADSVTIIYKSKQINM